MEQNKGGRPRKFESPEQLEQKINDYFAWCEQRDDFPEWTELACHLDVCKETLCEYAKIDGFSQPIKRAKQKCESAIAKGMLKGSMNATGSIFTLRNNYGWEDKQHVVISKHEIEF